MKRDAWSFVENRCRGAAKGHLRGLGEEGRGQHACFRRKGGEAGNVTAFRKLGPLHRSKPGPLLIMENRSSKRRGRFRSVTLLKKAEGG